MLDPETLYRCDPQSWELLRGKRPVLILLLDGAGSAGGVQRVLGGHLLEAFTATRVVRFDVDQLLQWADRRPMVEIGTCGPVRDTGPDLSLWALTDAAGETFLVLHGPEPMLQWNRTIAALAGIVAELGVRLVVNVTAIPMRVPHTRPAQVFTHSAEADLNVRPWEALGTVTVPASFGTYLESVLAEHRQRCLGVDVCVPYYLDDGEHIDSAVAALEVLQSTCGLNLAPDDLVGRAEANRAEVDAQVAQTANGTQVLQILETRYDSLRTMVGDRLPSADELGDAFEKFLADQDRRRRETGEG